MSILVAVAPEDNDTAVLHLASLLARSRGQQIALCTVVTASWDSQRMLDHEYRRHLRTRAQVALDRARALLPAELEVESHVHDASSIPAGLLEVAAATKAELIVLGSSRGRGLIGRVVLGSVTDRLLHGAQTPLIVAPRGFRVSPESQLSRVTVALGGSPEPGLVATAASFALDAGANLRVASFAVRPSTPFGSGAVVAGADHLVVKEWVKKAKRIMNAELAELGATREGFRREPEVVLGSGLTWKSALANTDWSDGDILAVGSSSTAPAASVFLGYRASKILQQCRVPVLVLARTGRTLNPLGPN